jgi:hypothetical protein
MKRDFILGVAGYSIATLALAAPWHFVFFKELYHGLGIYNRAEPIIPLGITSMLVQGAVMAWLYPKAYPRRSAWNAMLFSWAMGLFLFSVSTMANAAKINVSSISSWLAVQAAFHFVQFTLAGLVFAWIRRDSHGL